MKFIPPQLFLTYIAVCETGSFTRAAERVHNSQSTISQQINRLESMLGSTLLIRTPQKVLLTEQGEFVLRYAHKIIDLNTAMVDNFYEKSEQNIIKIGVPDDLSVDVTKAIVKFQHNYSILFEFTSGLSNNLYQAYQAGQYDLILVKQPILGNAYAYRKEPLLWLDSAAHPTFNNKIIPLVLFPTGALYREHILNSMDQLGYCSKINYCSSNLSAIITASSIGFGITLLPETCKTAEHSVIDELQTYAPSNDFYLALYVNNTHDMIVTKIADEIISTFNLKHHKPIN